MTDPDPRLAAFFAKDEPLTRDLAFEVALEARFARQRLLDDALDWIGYFCAAGAIAWAAQPVFAGYGAEIARIFGSWWPALVAAGSIAAAIWILRSSRVIRQ
jgi:hypothetical protein